MPIMTNGNVKPYTGMFGPPRNTLLSKWDLLFEKDPKEWIAFKPALGLHVYPCYACRHMFYSKRSFLYHMNRRAVVLTYTCPDCPNEKLTFYNRCAFLVHTRKHFSLQLGTIDLKNLKVSPLPFGLAGFTKNPDIPFLYDVEEQYNHMDVFVNSQFYAAKYEDRGKETITLTPSNLVINKTSPNGETQALSVLQIAKNIPKCQFILLEHLNRLRRQARISEEVDVQVKAEPPDETSQQNLGGTINGYRPSETQEITLPVITKIESVEETTENTAEQNGDPKGDNIPKHPMYKCPECKGQLEESLIDHFMAENRPADIKFKCDECRLICSSQCSYLAHIRIHDERAPYICPDCGQEFHEFNDLNTHMEDICFHSLKSVRYRCPKIRCAKLFASSQTYSTHFALHIDPLYKCLPCQILFRDLDLADEHIAIHRDQPDQHDVVPLYECSVCNLDEPFDEIGCKNHIEWHMNDLSKCLYIYLCKYCKSYFRATSTYAAHLVKCSVQNKAKKVVARRRMRDKPFFASKFETGECKKCKSRIIYAKGKPVDLCRKCIFAENKLSKLNGGTKEPHTNGTPTDGTVNDEKGINKILNETNNSENPNDTLNTTENTSNPEEKKQLGVAEKKRTVPRIRVRKHVAKPSVDPNSEKVVCILCKTHMLLSERKVHQRECRYARPEVFVERFDIGLLDGNLSMTMTSPSSDMDSSSGSYCSWGSSSRHSFETSSPNKPKRRRLFKPKKPVEVELDLTAEKPIEFDGTYACRLCDFKEPERATFHEHIKTHRQLSTAYQCMECGECFVVKRSLVIHIQHFHNIHEYEKYFNDNDCFDEAAVKELAKQVQMPHYIRNNVKDNQCKVCLQEFDSKEEVDKHFRVHGMAFLMQKNKPESA